jgi:serine/threonine protein kinase
MKDDCVNSAEKLEKFMNEVRLLSQCRHPHVVEISAVSLLGTLIKASGSKKDAIYYAMPFVKFGELYKVIRETGPFQEELARTLFLQALSGLEYLHSIGIAHRDIKPENLLLDECMKLVIADFGCAAICRTEAQKPIEFDSAQIVGSHEYNPPEINMEKSYFGEKSDIFALGVFVFLMVLGYQPFRKACQDDEYFMLFAKDKLTYWGIYSTVQVSPEFKGKILEY